MMNERDDWLLNLYDGEREMPLPNDPAYPAEASRLREMKDLLDARPRRSPDAGVVSAVLAAGRGEVVPRGVRQDRPPERRPRIVALRVGVVSAAAVLLIALVGLLQPGVFGLAEDGLQTDASSQEAGPLIPDATADARAPESIGTDRSIGADDTSRAQGEPARTQGLNADGAALPIAWSAQPDDPLSWDEQGDVIELHQRIDRIQRGVDVGWEAPAVPLEMMPGNRQDLRARPSAGQGLIQAGQQR